MKAWFTVDPIDENTFCISENSHWEQTHCYLLNGSSHSLLIDTGLGVCDIGRIVRELTDKTVIVVTTHAHWDHIGGHGCFSTHYVHPFEASWLQGAFPLPVELVRNMVSDCAELPPDFCIDRYTLFSCDHIGFLQDGEILSLGNRKIQALHTPGHSPGHLCFYEADRGYLFTGDLVYAGTLYAHYPSTDPKAFLHSLERISGYPFKRVFPGHYTLDLVPQLVFDMLFAFRELDEKGLLCHGSGVFSYDRWSIQL